MSCDTCGKAHHAQRSPFLCAVDARNRCYEGRVKLAQALLENEKLQRQIESVVSESSEEQNIARPVSAPNQSVAARFTLAEQRKAEEKTRQIIEQADKLQQELTVARKETEERRAALTRRKDDLNSASSGLSARRSRQLEDAERSIQMINYRWARGADSMARTRSFLCMEAAKLYGLRRVKKTGSSSRFEYKLGGVDIVDLETMHSASPEQLSTSLANVAHILALASHYLSIRLPAELTLPHREYPRPTIFTLASSYQHTRVPFPGSLNYGAGAGQHPKPRPLYVEKALPVLAKEDPAVYSMFLEGVTLLAYDVAWVCCTQGVHVGDKGSFEDVCHIGCNLYNLLIAQQQLQSTQIGDKSDGQALSLMGRYSHGTAHSFLGGTEGTDFARSFKLPSPMKLADSLKKKLANEVVVPEWEMLEPDAWTETGPGVDGGGSIGFGGNNDDGVVVSANTKNKEKTKSNKSNSGALRDPRAGSGNNNSGWTKVKNR